MMRSFAAARVPLVGEWILLRLFETHGLKRERFRGGQVVACGL